MKINVLKLQHAPQHPQNERNSSTHPNIIRAMPISSKSSDTEKPLIPSFVFPVFDANELRVPFILSSIPLIRPISDALYAMAPPIIKSKLII